MWWPSTCKHLLIRWWKDRLTWANICGVISVHARRILSFISSGVVGATAITRFLTKSLVLSILRQKFHSSLVLNTEYNGVVHRRVASTCSCEHSRACFHISRVRIFLRMQLLKLTRFRKSLPYKSWCNDIRFSLEIGRRLTRVCSDVLTLEGNAWLTDISTENSYFLPMSTISYRCVLSWVS